MKNEIDGEYKRLPLDKNLRPSSTNPRKIFDEAGLKELAKSIKNQGVAQPILVRPINGNAYEIVAGERRYRASILAEQKDIPTIIRNLTDEQAREIQIVENLQRKDLHPMEEAEGYKDLMQDYKYSADQLAEKVGKSRSYIYASLKLCALVPEARKIFYAGKLTPSLALLIARIPVPSLQIKAAKEIGMPQHGNGPMSQRNAISHIQRYYTLELKDAQFSPADDKLLPSAGACTTCEKRTGNQKGLPNDFDNADVCTDPQCFDKKREAWSVIRIKKAKADGQVILEGAEAKKVYPYSYSRPNDGFADPKEKCWEDPSRRTYGQLAKTAGVDKVLVKNPHTKMLAELVRIADLKPSFKELGISSSRSSTPSNSTANEAAKKAKAETEFRTELLTQVRAKMAAGKLTEADWRMIAFKLIYRLDNNDTRRLLGMIGWDKELASWGQQKKLDEKIQALSLQELHQLMFTAALIGEAYSASWSTGKPEVLLAAAGRYGVDPNKIKAELKAKEKAKIDAKKKGSIKASAKPAAPSKTNAASQTLKPVKGWPFPTKKLPDEMSAVEASPVGAPGSKKQPAKKASASRKSSSSEKKK